MADRSCIGINGIARKITGWYIGIGGKARKIKKAYIGVGGVARAFINDGMPDVLTWSDPISTDTEKLISQSTDGMTVVVQGDVSPGISGNAISNAIRSQPIYFDGSFKVEITPTDLSSDGSGTKMLSVGILDPDTSAIRSGGAASLLLNETFSWDGTRSPGYAQILLNGYYPQSSTYVTTATVSIKFTKLS